MSDSTVSKNSDQSLTELMELCLDRACIEAFKKPFREIEAILQRAGTPLSSQEIASLVTLGAALIGESNRKDAEES